jgi:hypothetical protein
VATGIGKHKKGEGEEGREEKREEVKRMMIQIRGGFL